MAKARNNMEREEAIEKVREMKLSPGKDAELIIALHTLIPELRESEDERIRAVILKLVLGMRDEIFTTADKLVTKPKVLAYLERQKEPVVGKEGMYYYLGGEFIYCGYPATEESQQEKQKEQKPEDRFEEAREKYQVEWSEEDEKMRNRLIDRLQFITLTTRTDTTSPNITFFDEIDWLKSLRPSWKPSEEQMEALRVTIDFMPDTFKPRCTLMTLQNDLEKLI